MTKLDIKEIPKVMLTLDYNELSHIYNSLRTMASTIDYVRGYTQSHDEDEYGNISFEPTDLDLQLEELGEKIGDILEGMKRKAMGELDD